MKDMVIKMEVYLDNAATTEPFLHVRDIIVKTLEEDFGNPSSLHRKGIKAEQYIKRAQEQVARTLKCQPKEIVFTSGGTESNNMALIGAALAKRRQGKHLITTQIEHASVQEPMRFLEELGFEVTYLPVDACGIVEPKTLAEAVREDTVLVSVMYVNNEIGSVQNIVKLSRTAKEKKPDVIVHVDAIQAYGKFQIQPKKEGIDLLSASAHKIHGAKGAGFLYVSEKVRIKPLLYGGGQQKGMRSGTENVPGIAGLGAAAEEIYKDYMDAVDALYEKKEYLICRLLELEGVAINGMPERVLAAGDRELAEAVRATAPHIVNASFSGVRSEVLLHELEDKKIYVSSGSACSSNHPKQSSTLQAIGVKKEFLDCALRFSMSVYTTKEELDYTVDVIRELLPVLRRFI